MSNVFDRALSACFNGIGCFQKLCFLLFPLCVAIGQFSSNWPGWSSRTVTHFYEFTLTINMFSKGYGLQSLSQSVSLHGQSVGQFSQSVSQSVCQATSQLGRQPANQSVDQPASQTVCQSVSQSIGQSVSQSVNQSVSLSVCLSFSQSVS